MSIRKNSLATIAVLSISGTVVVLRLLSGSGSAWRSGDGESTVPPAVLNEVFSEENVQRGRISAAVYQGVALYEQGYYGEAVEKHREALQLAEDIYSPDEYPGGHHDLAVCLQNLGFALHADGEFDEALAYYERALAMFEALHTLQDSSQSAGDPEWARCLRNYGALLAARGRLEAGRRQLERALEMWKSFESQPIIVERRIARDGAPDAPATRIELAVTAHRTIQARQMLPLEVAACREALARVYRDQGDYETAHEFVERALAGYVQRFGPLADAPPSPALTRCLDTQAGLLQLEGDYDGARRSFERALEMSRRLYPSGKFPNGHTNLAIAHNNLAILLASQGEFEEALRHYEDALAMLERLYPEDDHPRGHIQLAGTLMNLGDLHLQRGEPSQAADRLRDALHMQRRLFPADSFPSGHPEIARTLTNLGRVIRLLGQVEQAEELLTESYAMRQRLYPPAEYPAGHIDLAGSLDSLGWFHWSQGNPDEALAYYRDALAMRRKLYPAERYPGGHPELARTLIALAGILYDAGDLEAAAETAITAAEMAANLAEEFYATSSEAEALNYAAQQEVRDLLLSIWPRTQRPVDELYEHVAHQKGAIFRAAKRRQELLRRSLTPENRAAYEEYRNVRQKIARLTLTPVSSDPERRQRLEEQLAELSRRKEAWERRLGGTLLDPGASSPQDGALHARLLELLPADAAVIDFIRYRDWNRESQTSDPEIRNDEAAKAIAPGAPPPAGFRGRGELRYAAFILQRGRSVSHVDLGPAAPIDAVVRDWRKAIAAEQESEAAGRLSELLWAKLEPHLHEDVATILLSPDGRLATLPFAALPARDGSGILLERYALATVPSTRFLLDQLAASTAETADGIVLAVGDVDYGDPAAEGKGRRESPAGRRVVWPPLPATRTELADLKALADGVPVVALRGDNADPAAVIAELSQARWAHFATHGFFADGEFRAALGRGESRSASLSAERTTAIQRNPLVRSGLVLAGANRLSEPSRLGDDVGGGGILSAEAIAALPLYDLEFVMLSACETGLGDVAGGEGVFGLQRAFHLAGARNVVGSLWRVDDAATAALMRLFYFKLWKQDKPPLAALREAQLAVYRNPARVSSLAALRAPDFGELVNVPVYESSAADAALVSNGRTATRLWAGFVLSGVGDVGRDESKR